MAAAKSYYCDNDWLILLLGSDINYCRKIKAYGCGESHVINIVATVAILHRVLAGIRTKNLRMM